MTADRAPQHIVEVPQARWDGIRLPDPGRPDDRLLADANRRGREGALEMLGRLLPDLPFADLAQTTDGASFHTGPATSDFDDLLDVRAMVDRLLTWGDLHGEQLILVRELERLPVDQFQSSAGPNGRGRARVGRIAEAVRDGYTLVFNGVDLRDPSSMRLVEAAERVWGCVCNINGYLSLRPSMSFGAHWDDQDTVILQLIGRKSWALEEPRALSMVKEAHGSATSGRTIWEGVLTGGASLYIPRGWGHRVRSIDQLSYHYTLTVPRTNGTRLLTGIAQTRTPRETGAANLPLAGGNERHRELGLDASDERVREVLALTRLNLPSRSTRQISGSLDPSRRRPGVWVRSPFPGGWVAVAPRSADGRRLIGAAGRQFAVSARGMEVVAGWADGLGRRWPTDPEEAVLVEGMVHLGILDTSTDDPGWGYPVAAGS